MITNTGKTVGTNLESIYLHFLLITCGMGRDDRGSVQRLCREKFMKYERKCEEVSHLDRSFPSEFISLILKLVHLVEEHGLFSREILPVNTKESHRIHHFVLIFARVMFDGFVDSLTTES